MTEIDKIKIQWMIGEYLNYENRLKAEEYLKNNQITMVKNVIAGTVEGLASLKKMTEKEAQNVIKELGKIKDK